uniref:CSN8/PSMD8/EIF3K domain-containing protein n=1 Tax=Hanusia phi TaxID=3032 RepID=A0A7S0DU88_9CRYP
MELEHVGQWEPAQVLPFYRVQLLCYVVNDLVNARWLWERMPDAVKQDPEIIELWKIARLLWKQDPSAFSHILDPKWAQSNLGELMALLLEQLREKKLLLISQSHSTISLKSCSLLLGMSETEVQTLCMSKNWEVSGNYVKPTRPTASSEHDLSPDQLQALTDYVCSLDAR